MIEDMEDIVGLIAENAILKEQNDSFRWTLFGIKADEIIEDNKEILGYLKQSEDRDVHLALIGQVQEILSITVKLGRE